MRGDAETVHALNAVDWDFPGARTAKYSVHALHWFPGNFIPQIPSYLVQILSEQSDTVFDPFCGSGTTGVEALRLGRNALQSDANAVSVDISRAKLALNEPDFVIDALLELSRQLVWEHLVRSDAPGSCGEGTAAELTRWFSDDTLSQLRGIWRQIEQIDGEARHFAEMIFSDALFACASTGRAKTRTGKLRRHHWGWVADNVRPKSPLRPNATAIFLDRIMNAIEVLRHSELLTGKSFGVLRQDTRCLAIDDASVDLIVTSPPYLSMIDYARANRLHYLWRGWSMKADAILEVGARYRRKGIAGTVSSYLKAMTEIVGELHRVLKPGAYCAIVIGASRIHPEMAQHVVDLFAGQLRLVWGPKTRQPSRRRVSAKTSRDGFELVSVFRKMA